MRGAYAGDVLRKLPQLVVLDDEQRHVGMVCGHMANPFAPQEYSEETARRIDAAIDRLLEEAHARALTVLRDNRATLDAIAAALMRDESLDREELTAIVNAHRAPGQAPLPVPTGPPTELAGTTG